GYPFRCLPDQKILDYHLQQTHKLHIPNIGALTFGQRYLHHILSIRFRATAGRKATESSRRRALRIARVRQQEDRILRRLNRLRPPMDRLEIDPPYLHRYRVALPAELKEMPSFGCIGRPFITTVPNPSINSTPPPVSPDTPVPNSRSSSEATSVYRTSLNTPSNNSTAGQQLDQARLQTQLAALERREEHA